MQSKIDAIAYPPTHTYRLDGLVPTGVLAKRVEIIDRVVPGLFDGRAFLDIGANKGYFSLRAAMGCDRVVSIEPREDCVRLLSEIATSNMTVFDGTFKGFKSRKKFDRIFLGNGPHYPFIEDKGWRWVKKLAKMSSGTVLMEAAKGMECHDMHGCIPTILKPLYNWDAMQVAFGKYFELMSVEPAYQYTPDRYVMHFERK